MGLAPNKLLSNCPNIDTDIPREDINHDTHPTMILDRGCKIRTDNTSRKHAYIMLTPLNPTFI